MPNEPKDMPENWITAPAGLLGWNNRYFKSSPLLAAALTGTAAGGLGYLGGSIADYFGDQAEDYLPDALAGKFKERQKKKRRSNAKSFGLIGLGLGAAPGLLLAGNDILRGRNPLNSEITSWDPNYTRDRNVSTISTPKALNVGPKKNGSYDSELGPPLLRPIPVGALIEKVMGNPYLSSQEKETSVSTFDRAQSLGGKWVTPVTFGLLNAATGGGFLAGAMGGLALNTALNYLTDSQPSFANAIKRTLF